eukprot:CAMPEP_0119275500 /NCGR_PEP_ID=MMETSP1329-20130426/13849_1 /TAXON_ID=114041 /ORGANISM="Genus nov. species nov., Strain RCC1024" /LENGTH=60 /DNA_ID=CAMNT_0007275881 /DNA_START=31 /DNA_END=210 /DNA_ORIENTATION=+
MMSVSGRMIGLALALAIGANAQLPYCKDAKEKNWVYDAGDKGEKGCQHVDLLPSKRCETE